MTNETKTPNLENKIAKVFSDDIDWHTENKKPWDGTRAAKAVLALVRESVPELVWMCNGNHWAGGHGYVVRKIGSQYTLTIRNQHGRQFDTLEDAKAVAQAHYAAQLTDWMMK